jgi:hypothetical protein
MAHKHEVKRLEADLQLDESLKTEAGRLLRWQELGSEAATDSLIELFIRTFGLQGDVIECGVYRGASLFKLLWAVKQHGIRRTVWACDSFEGFPSDGIKSVDSTLFRPVSKLQQKFKLAQDVPARIERFAPMYDTPVQVAKGYFSDTLPTLPLTPLAFIHLDADIYESPTKSACSGFTPCLCPVASWCLATTARPSGRVPRGLSMNSLKARGKRWSWPPREKIKRGSCSDADKTS